jgi:hypothetical protein
MTGLNIRDRSSIRLSLRSGGFQLRISARMAFTAWSETAGLKLMKCLPGPKRLPARRAGRSGHEAASDTKGSNLQPLITRRANTMPPLLLRKGTYLLRYDNRFRGAMLPHGFERFAGFVQWKLMANLSGKQPFPMRTV